MQTTKHYFWNEREFRKYLKKYNSTRSRQVRNEIYEQYLYSPLYELSGFVLARYYSTYLGEQFNVLRLETLAELTQSLSTYKATKKTKAFTYFIRVAENYLRKLYKHNMREKRDIRCLLLDEFISTKSEEHIDIEDRDHIGDNMTREMTAYVAAFWRLNVDTHFSGIRKKVVLKICDILDGTKSYKSFLAMNAGLCKVARSRQALHSVYAKMRPINKRLKRKYLNE